MGINNVANAAPVDRMYVAANEATKWGHLLYSMQAGTAAFAWTGPAAPIFGVRGCEKRQCGGAGFNHRNLYDYEYKLYENIRLIL